MPLSPERQNARMSKITNDGLTRSGTGCVIAVPVWHQWTDVKGIKSSDISLRLNINNVAGGSQLSR